jgi:2,3-bisphosphoglycerate-dependent phosphoglycerate mutase
LSFFVCFVLIDVHYNHIMQLLFIRHGQSANNALWDSTGASTGRSEDPELTAAGKQQAALLAQYMSQGGNRFGITHLYTSLMVRSIETAVAVGQALNVPVNSWEDTHETGGIYEDNDEGVPIGLPGKTRAQLMSAYPALVLPDGLYESGWWNRPFESYEAVPARAQRFLADLQARHGHTGDVVAMVSHGNFYRYMLAALLQLPNPQSVWFGINNTALSHIVFPRHEDEVLVVQYQNRIEHLPAALIT